MLFPTRRHRSVSKMDHFGANPSSDRVEIREIQLEPMEIQPLEEERQPRRWFFRRKFDRLYDVLHSIDDRVNKSTFGRVFRLKGSGHVSTNLFAAPTSR